ncbi:cobalt-zinc-cadmium efflux system membrane fusion protein [Chryseobacterium sp. H1D6B]|uniref:efflux RND transporter periplasmic adaptor subunit n=1 Tax=Chryseobacterium sp. H1D6B TaxID=2940588 RepID=UPI0015CECF13|nr:efflux RND transporter periplasmic adaptor subunit [Chryseobacterium sp. H1D6B]MDH6250834.1 cobalt-zinc-cadmium efflux system membrane fusion protein [Chryseobacterium sp. H1D6B]
MVINKFYIKTILPAVLLVFIVSCNDSKTPISQKNTVTAQGNRITISENNPVLKKILTETVTEKEYSSSITSVGTIETIPTNYAEIASPFSGRVIKSFVNIGQRVSAGSPVFEIISPDYFSIQKEYSDALNDSKLAEKNYRRQQDLVRHGVGIQRELEEAETEYKNKKTSLSNTSSALQVYNSKGSGGSLIVRAPISGEVISNKLVTGQYLKEDAEPVMIIAALSKVWISGDVKEKDIRFIKNGDPVSVNVSTYPDLEITGKVYHINEILNEDTRSIKVIIQCDNPEKKLKPGMFATISYSTNSEKAILIPDSALLQKGGSQYVWIKTGKNQFTKRIVTPGESIEKRVKIISGLQAGDILMSQGGIYMPDTR